MCGRWGAYCTMDLMPIEAVNAKAAIAAMPPLVKVLASAPGSRRLRHRPCVLDGRCVRGDAGEGVSCSLRQLLWRGSPAFRGVNMQVGSRQ